MSEVKTSEQTQPTYLSKWAGKTFKTQLPTPSLTTVAWSFIGAFVGILVVAYLAKEAQLFPLFAPFGASAVLLYGAPAAPFSQPRNLIGGHLISAFIGVTAFILLGDTYISIALAVSLAMSLMMLTKTVHPPAGATALLGVISSKGSYMWLLTPVAVGAVILLLIALLVNNLSGERSYPNYWC